MGQGGQAGPTAGRGEGGVPECGFPAGAGRPTRVAGGSVWSVIHVICHLWCSSGVAYEAAISRAISALWLLEGATAAASVWPVRYCELHERSNRELLLGCSGRCSRAAGPCGGLWLGSRARVVDHVA